MLTINRLREFLSETKEIIPEIKYVQVIITNEEFVKFLEERKTADNTMIFAVVPEHSVSGSEDKTKYENFLQFFIIDKSADKDLKHDLKLDLYNKIQGIVSQFIKLILDAKSGESEYFHSCNLFNELNEESIEIKVFWDNAQCRGYEILLDLKSNI